MGALTLAEVGLNTTSHVQMFRAELKNLLPLIDAEIGAVKLVPASNIGRIMDFCEAALDLKD